MASDDYLQGCEQGSGGDGFVSVPLPGLLWMLFIVHLWKGSVMKKAIIRFLREEEGASAVEYALIAAMVALALVTFVDPINAAITSTFGSICQTLNGGVAC